MCFGYVSHSTSKLTHGKSAFLGVCESKGASAVCCITNLVI